MTGEKIQADLCCNFIAFLQRLKDSVTELWNATKRKTHVLHYLNLVRMKRTIGKVILIAAATGGVLWKRCSWNVAKFTGKHLRKSLFSALLKRDSGTSAFQ